MKSISLSDVAVYVIALCSIGVASLAIRHEFFSSRPSPATPRPVPQWESIARAGNSLGANSAPVRVVEFSDFQCPFCARAEKVLRRLREQNPSTLRIAYLHFPLTAIHPSAYPAAITSECAARQKRFQAYHDSLFNHSD